MVWRDDESREEVKGIERPEGMWVGRNKQGWGAEVEVQPLRKRSEKGLQIGALLTRRYRCMSVEPRDML